jgi:hypothetical protein
VGSHSLAVKIPSAKEWGDVEKTQISTNHSNFPQAKQTSSKSPRLTLQLVALKRRGFHCRWISEYVGPRDILSNYCSETLILCHERLQNVLQHSNFQSISLSHSQHLRYPWAKKDQIPFPQNPFKGTFSWWSRLLQIHNNTTKKHNDDADSVQNAKFEWMCLTTIFMTIPCQLHCRSCEGYTQNVTLLYLSP